MTGAGLPTTLVDAETVARYLDVERDWVYAHAIELGARRLGTGPKARLRFSLLEVDELLQDRASCSGSREPEEAAPPVPAQAQRRRRRRRLGTGAAAVPIRGGRGIGSGSI